MLQMVIKLLRRLEEGHLRFLDLKKKKKTLCARTRLQSQMTI